MTFPRTVLQAPPAAPEILARCRELVAPALVEAIDGLHPWVAEMAGYALGRCEVGGAPATHRQGKGVRQALALLGAEAAGGSAEAGVPGAVAVELLHTFSLLHDDIMDGDALRRGRPAVWKAYGTGPAVLAGDALFALAVETLTASPASPHAAAAVGRLTRASRDLVRGQADDLLFAHRPWTGPDAVSTGEYEAMAEHKTGALLGCALALGAELADAPRRPPPPWTAPDDISGWPFRSPTTCWASGAIRRPPGNRCRVICGRGRRPSRCSPPSPRRAAPHSPNSSPPPRSSKAAP